MKENRLNEFKSRKDEYLAEFNRRGKYNLNTYFNAVESNILTAEHIKNILCWKLAGKRTYNQLPKNHQRLVKRAVKKLHEINLFKKGKISCENFNDTRKYISPHGPVIRLFIYHVCKPIEFPLFDRHVYRAFNYIETGKIYKDGLNEKIIEKSYAKYKAFFNKRCNYSKDLHKRKDMDSALMVFGKKLKKRVS